MEVVRARSFQSLQNLIGIAAIDAGWISNSKMFAGDGEISLVRRRESRRDEIFMEPGTQQIPKLRKSEM